MRPLTKSISIQRFLLTALLALAFSSCRTRVDLQNGVFNGKHVKMGSDISLLNKSIEVVLVKDGRIYMSDLSGSYKEIHKMKRLHAWALMQGVKKSGIRDKVVDKPGQMMSYYVQYNTKKNQYRWSWGKDGAAPPDELKDEMDDLISIMKNEKKASFDR